MSGLKALAAVSVLGLVVSGCAQQEPQDAVSGLRVNAPLESPAWDPRGGTVFAIRQADRSLVKVDVTPGGIATGEGAASTVSEQFSGLGENLAPDLRESGNVYVPRPEQGMVTIVGAEDLLSVRSFEAGPSPSQLALAGPTTQNSGLGDTLFALSQDGTTVTGVALDSYRQVVQREIDVGNGALLEASEAGSDSSFWAAGSTGVVFYSGSNLVGPLQSLDLDVSALAVDPENGARAYVGESSSGRLAAVEAVPGGLQVTDEADLGSDVESLATSEGLLYAATTEALIALNPQNLNVVYRADFGQPMREAVAGRATPSGITFSGENAYITLEGSPYVVEVGKPEGDGGGSF